jgi:hypothetical protein
LAVGADHGHARRGQHHVGEEAGKRSSSADLANCRLGLNERRSAARMYKNQAGRSALDTIGFSKDPKTHLHGRQIGHVADVVHSDDAVGSFWSVPRKARVPTDGRT